MTKLKLFHDGRPELELGQRVTFTHKAKATYSRPLNRYGTTLRVMLREPMTPDLDLFEGVFVGWRNAQEGKVNASEDGPQFKVEDRPLVALIAYDSRRNPVTVFPTDVTPMLRLEGERHNAKREAVAEVGDMIRDKVRMGDNSECEAAAGDNAVREYLEKLGEWEQ